MTTRDGETSGPPGVGLIASGGDYACSQVTVDFSGERLGQAPVEGGRFRASGLTAPGDARPGAHTVTAHCGSVTLASTTFDITDRAVHRPPLVTQLPTPTDISFSLIDLAKSGGVALVIIPVIFFPFAIIEEVMDDNYDEILGWFGLTARPREKTGWSAVPALVLFMAVAAAVYAGLDPGFGFNLSTGVLFVGLLFGLSAVVMSGGAPSLAFARRRRVRAPLRALPGSLVVALAVVILSRLVNFHPGYAFGAVAGFTIAAELGRRERGRVGAASILSLTAVALMAWVAWLPVQRMASAGDPSLGLVILETALVSTFLLGLETALILALPIRFVPGGEVAKWNRWAWAAMFAVVALPAIHILLGRGNHTIAEGDVRPWVIVAVTAFFAVFTVAFWGYFRFRPERSGAMAAPRGA